MTTLEQTKPKNTEPCPYRGVAIIDYWLKRIDTFFLLGRNTAGYTGLFKTIFKDDAKHLLGKNWREDFGGFFLNLDNKNQVAFLNFISINEIDLTFPGIPGWESIGEKFGMKEWDQEYTQEDVRSCVVGFRQISEWDAYPHDLVWLRKFILYAYNNAIENENYKGEKFGNFENWSKYYCWIGIQERTDLCKLLVEYS